ncbi:MAG TPA: 5-(carboxyamino)imidazole ribonucleotide synthase [Acidimicrobiales bacterium]
MRRGFATVLAVSSPEWDLVCRSCPPHSCREASHLKPHHVGFVGAGQLARMAGEAASALGLSMVVLAEHPDDAACAVASEVVIGTPRKLDDLRALAERCQVITFDHEQVNLDYVAQLSREGAIVRPGADALHMAVDKGHMRSVLVEAGLPVPAHVVIENGPASFDALRAFGAEHGWPMVVKTTQGGYDGKGVWQLGEASEAADLLEALAQAGPLLLEELVPLDAELAVMVARRPNGERVTWPAVETAQVGGVCREVLVPGRLDPSVTEAATALGGQVADLAGAVGVMAVELFWSKGQLLVNEVATRPHNSGHWTIEGAVTSQFENHLRAVLDLPLGLTVPQYPHVASVNVFGGPAGHPLESLLPRALAFDGAHVHLYGKETRPGRKLGHVTVCGAEAETVRARAWGAALALGSPHPPGLDLPDGVTT